MKIFKDNFDSNIFKNNIGKCYIDNKLSIADKKNLNDINNYDVLFLFTKFNNENIEFLEKKGFNFISIRSYYKLIDNSIKSELNNSNLVFIEDDYIKLLNYKSIEKLANILGNTSRYYKDNLLNKNNSKELYKKWILNVLGKKYGNGGFLYKDGDKLIGIINLIIKGNIGYIDLIGIDNKYQGKGYGKSLLNRGINYLINKNVEKIFVITEGENIQANQFYQKNGFIIDDIELVYHKHFN